MRSRKGFLLPAPFWIIVAGIVYTAALGWAFILDHVPTAEQNWF